MNGQVDVILPCLDEAQALPGVLAALPPGYRALVVDNGSTGGTPEIAAALGATVQQEPRRGYGAAVHAGLVAASAEVVAVLDADGSLDPGASPAMVALLAQPRISIPRDARLVQPPIPLDHVGNVVLGCPSGVGRSDCSEGVGELVT
jgi:glycosyltransferase involved in cell wall biosynthesis